MKVIVRHPDPFYGDEAFTFRSEAIKELTLKGIERAEAFALFLKTLNIRWDWAVCSPTKRTLELLNIVELVLGIGLRTAVDARIRGTEVYQPEQLNDMYSQHMEQNGIAELSCYRNIWEQMEAFQPVCVSHQYFHEGIVTESWEAVHDRVMPFFKGLLEKEGNGLVFTHFEVMWVTLKTLGFKADPAKIVFCDYMLIDQSKGKCVITCQGQTKVI